MKYKFLYFALFAGLCFSNTLSASTFTWTGAGDGVSWNDESNWNDGDGFLTGDGIPLNSDDVIINGGTPIVNVANLVANNLTINGGTLSINPGIALDIEGDFLMNGGILGFQNSIFMNISLQI